MKRQKTRAFHKLVAEVSVPDSLVKLCESRGADYVGDQGFGVYVARVIVNDAPVMLRINAAGEQITVHPVCKSIQKPEPLSAWPVAGTQQQQRAA